MAAGIQSADELVLTEMVFNGVFSPLSSQQAVALLSCFLWHEKSDVGTKVTPRCISLMELPTETWATAVPAHAHCASRAATGRLASRLIPLTARSLLQVPPRARFQVLRDSLSAAACLTSVPTEQPAALWLGCLGLNPKP